MTQRGAVVWLTGLSGAGKTTLAQAAATALASARCASYVLDGDTLRRGLCSDLGFSDRDRSENIRRAAQVAAILSQAGVTVLAAFISPFAADRALARSLVPPGLFHEVYCKCPLSVCETRDVKGLYRRARAGDLHQFTGISSPFEEPAAADLVIDTAHTSAAVATRRLVEYLAEHGIGRAPG